MRGLITAPDDGYAGGPATLNHKSRKPGCGRCGAAVDQQPRPAGYFEAGASNSIQGLKPIAGKPFRARHCRFQAIRSSGFVNNFCIALIFVIVSELGLTDRRCQWGYNPRNPVGRPKCARAT
jgi:hypothetical protein